MRLCNVLSSKYAAKENKKYVLLAFQSHIVFAISVLTLNKREVAR